MTDLSLSDFDHIFPYCPCATCGLPVELARYGYVACTPLKPQVACSMQFLKLVYEFWSASHTPLTSVAESLAAFHKRSFDNILRTETGRASLLFLVLFLFLTVSTGQGLPPFNQLGVPFISSSQGSRRQTAPPLAQLFPRRRLRR